MTRVKNEGQGTGEKSADIQGQSPKLERRAFLTTVAGAAAAACAGAGEEENEDPAARSITQGLCSGPGRLRA